MKSASFFSILKSEHLKSKYNIGVWLILSFPIIATIGTDIYVLSKTAEAINNPQAKFDYNPWIYILGRYIFQYYSLLYPILVSILCYSLWDMEYKNNGFRLLFTRPINKKEIYSSKVFFILEILLISILIAFLLFWGSGYLLGYMPPGYDFSGYEINKISFIYFVRLFIGITAISMIQHFLSLLFKSFVLPIGFASMVTMFCLMGQNWKYIGFIPYNTGWQSFIGFVSGSISLSNSEYINMIYILFFLIVSYFIFKRKK